MFVEITWRLYDFFMDSLDNFYAVSFPIDGVSWKRCESLRWIKTCFCGD